MPKRYLHGAA
uniref:Uncharacterized protein n=1 Tax=Anguilla anguilla TaxID=7936 RepID=A0A0E9UAW4_ANGAN